MEDIFANQEVKDELKKNFIENACDSDDTASVEECESIFDAHWSNKEHPYYSEDELEDLVQLPCIQEILKD